MEEVQLAQQQVDKAQKQLENAWKLIVKEIAAREVLFLRRVLQGAKGMFLLLFPAQLLDRETCNAMIASGSEKRVYVMIQACGG